MNFNIKSQMATLIFMIKVIGGIGTLATGSPYHLAVAVVIAEVVKISDDIISGR